MTILLGFPGRIVFEQSIALATHVVRLTRLEEEASSTAPPLRVGLNGGELGQMLSPTQGTGHER